MADLHRIATQGYGQGAQTYARGRPGFPSQTLDWLKQYLQLHPGKIALELGAGTGKFTSVLAQTGATPELARSPTVTMPYVTTMYWCRVDSL